MQIKINKQPDIKISLAGENLIQAKFKANWNTPIANLSLGMEEVTDNWTYLSPSEVTVPSGAINKYSVGMKVRYKQGGGWKYGYIFRVDDTRLRIWAGTSFTIANSSITDIWVSRNLMIGFPDVFSWNPTRQVESGTPPSFGLIDNSRFCMNGRKVDYWLHWVNTSGGTAGNGGGGFYFYPPTASQSIEGNDSDLALPQGMGRRRNGTTHSPIQIVAHYTSGLSKFINPNDGNALSGFAMGDANHRVISGFASLIIKNI